MRMYVQHMRKHSLLLSKTPYGRSGETAREQHSESSLLSNLNTSPPPLYSECTTHTAGMTIKHHLGYWSMKMICGHFSDDLGAERDTSSTDPGLLQPVRRTAGYQS